VVVVTGSRWGIGTVVAKQLVAAGAVIYLAEIATDRIAHESNYVTGAEPVIDGGLAAQ
jgi:NADP-dependent 3-hydroxy acid dehydrogenase YdfG